MKLVKLFALFVIVTIVTVISWIIGNMIGNSLTHSMPPPPVDTLETAKWFFRVCVFNSILMTLLVEVTRNISFLKRSLILTTFVFFVQFLLPQMESFFFAAGIGITNAQTGAKIGRASCRERV